MNIRALLILLFLGNAGLVYASNDSDAINRIDIYTQEQLYPASKFNIYLNNPQFPPFNMVVIEEIEALEKIISVGLPNDETQAKGIAHKRTSQYQSEIVKAWQGHFAIRSLGITRLPAIVFNGSEAIWYGGRLDRAIQAFYAHKKEAQ